MLSALRCLFELCIRLSSSPCIFAFVGVFFRWWLEENSPCLIALRRRRESSAWFLGFGGGVGGWGGVLGGLVWVGGIGLLANSFVGVADCATRANGH